MGVWREGDHPGDPQQVPHQQGRISAPRGAHTLHLGCAGPLDEVGQKIEQLVEGIVLVVDPAQAEPPRRVAHEDAATFIEPGDLDEIERIDHQLVPEPGEGDGQRESWLLEAHEDVVAIRGRIRGPRRCLWNGVPRRGARLHGSSPTVASRQGDRIPGTAGRLVISHCGGDADGLADARPLPVNQRLFGFGGMPSIPDPA